jgi:hypothetical protein
MSRRDNIQRGSIGQVTDDLCFNVDTQFHSLNYAVICELRAVLPLPP